MQLGPPTAVLVVEFNTSPMGPILAGDQICGAMGAVPVGGARHDVPREGFNGD